MIRRLFAIVTILAPLAACATSSETPNNFTAERTVFDNPYVAPEFATQGIGPGKDALDLLIYPGRGKFAYDREGNRVRLTREEQRVLERRQALIEAGSQGQNQPQALPIPTAPPIAQSSEPDRDESDARPIPAEPFRGGGSPHR